MGYRNELFFCSGKVKVKAGLILTATLLAFAIVELTFRIPFQSNQTSPKADIACKKLDRFLIHVHIPNTQCSLQSMEWSITYSINSHGMRDFEYSLEKGENIYRILLIGDSFIEGVGVNIEDSTGKILEKSLANLNGKKVEVMQMGVAGWSPLTEYLYLARNVVDFKPDLVILTFNATDFRDEYYHFDLLTTHGKSQIENENSHDLVKNDQDLNYFQIDLTTHPGEKENKGIVGNFKKFLTNNSAIFSGLEKIKAAYNRRFSKSSVRTNMLAITDTSPPKDYKEAFDYPQKSILKIKDLLDKQMIGLLLVVFPHGHVIDEDEWKIGRLEYGFKVGKVYSNKPHEDLTGWAESQGITTFDLLQKMREAPRDMKLFFDQDGHWTTDGHRVAAEGITQFLLKSPLFPSP